MPSQQRRLTAVSLAARLVAASSGFSPVAMPTTSRSMTSTNSIRNNASGGTALFGRKAGVASPEELKAFVEAARTLAELVLASESSDDARLDLLGLRVLSRRPSAEERSLLLDLLDQHRVQYRGDPAAAAALLGVGERAAAGDIDPVELAAWTSLARVYLNLGEAITRR